MWGKSLLFTLHGLYTETEKYVVFVRLESMIEYVHAGHGADLSLAFIITFKLASVTSPFLVRGVADDGWRKGWRVRNVARDGWRKGWSVRNVSYSPPLSPPIMCHTPYKKRAGN